MKTDNSDLAIRKEALGVGLSYIVEAPAGSGKTALLTARFLALVATGGHGGGRCHPRRILAVTFTEKAAAEMKDRIALWLNRAADKDFKPAHEWDCFMLDLAQKARRAFAGEDGILLSPSSYRVSTFHSFCSSVIGGWPREAEVPVGSLLLSTQEQKICYLRAVREVFEICEAAGPGDEKRQALESRLAALNGNYSALEGDLVYFLVNRHQFPDIVECLAAGDLGKAEDRVKEGLVACLRAILGPASDYFEGHSALWRKLSHALLANEKDNAQRLPMEIPATTPDAIEGWLQTAKAFLDSKHNKRGLVDGKSRFPSKMPTELQAFVMEIPDDAVESLRRIIGKNLDPEDKAGLHAIFEYLILAAEAQKHLADYIPGRGLDYLELELGALRVLQWESWRDSPSDGLIFFEENLCHILVDEAQDLNPTQVKLLDCLTEGWEQEGPASPRTIFVVGDPKQSIYRFRGSEVSLFRYLREAGIPPENPRLRFAAANRLRLWENHRSEPGLVQFTNALFQKIMGETVGDLYDEVPFGASDASREASEGAPTIQLVLMRAKEGQAAPCSAPDMQATAAEWLATRVKSLYGAQRQDSVAVLIPRRTHLGPYVAAFKRHGIAVRMTEGEKLANKPEIIHLHNLFKALARPYDDLAWAGVVRAPWSRVSDSGLVELTNMAKGYGSLEPKWVGWRGAILEATLCETLPEVDLQVLRRLRADAAPSLKDFGRGPLARALQGIWEAMGGPAVVSQHYGSGGITNCLRYFEFLERASGGTLEETLAGLNLLLVEAYTPPDPLAANSNVQLMTIHSAKGLEFDHVFLPCLEYNPLSHGGGKEPPFLFLSVPLAGGHTEGAGRGRTMMVAVEGDRRKDEKYLSHELLKDLNRGRERAEAKRLLYVGVTRARKGLTLMGSLKPPAKKDDPNTAPCFEAEKESPLSLLLKAMTEGTALAGPFKVLNTHMELVEVLPGTADQSAATQAPNITLDIVPPASPFEPARLPYQIKRPSDKDLADDDMAPRAAGSGGLEDGGAWAAAVGVVVHRLMETLAKTDDPTSLPSSEDVAGALRTEGVDKPAARTLAPKLLEHARRAWADLGFVKLRQEATRHTEWAIEHFDGSETVMDGRLDLVLEKPDELVIVDYKTGSAPRGQALGEYRTELAKFYRGQIKAYAKMIQALLGMQGKRVSAFLLLTQLETDRLVPVELE